MEEVAAIQREAYHHDLQGEFEAAFALKRKAIGLAESILNSYSEYLATDLDMLAIDLYEANQYVEAEALFRRAMVIYRARESPADVAATLQWLAFVYDDLRQYQKALQHLNAALRMGGAEYKADAKLLRIYADLLNVTGRKVRARAVKARAQALQRRKDSRKPRVVRRRVGKQTFGKQTLCGSRPR